jgi:hypothetical protein
MVAHAHARLVRLVGELRGEIEDAHERLRVLEERADGVQRAARCSRNAHEMLTNA